MTGQSKAILWHNVGSMLASRLRRRANIEPTLGQSILFARYQPFRRISIWQMAVRACWAFAPILTEAVMPSSNLELILSLNNAWPDVSIHTKPFWFRYINLFVSKCALCCVFLMNVAARPGKHVGPLLVYCWATVYDHWPTLHWYRFNVSCLLFFVSSSEE